MSKANQTFKQNDEAVSPVIGVILMVAITVVLAAVVFVLVSNLGKGSEKAPSISFTKDETADRISIVSADAGLEVGHFSIKNSASDASSCGYNSPADDDLLLAAYDAMEDVCTGVVAPTEATEVNGGDSIFFCNEGGMDDVTISIRHEDSNTLVYETTFTSLADCP